MRQRKLNRKNNHDYSEEGWYFVTIVTKDRLHFFGEIKNGEMVLNEFGEIAKQFFVDIPIHFEYALLDEFVIMPNHIHGIIEINNTQVGNEITVGNADLRSLSRSVHRSQ